MKNSITFLQYEVRQLLSRNFLIVILLILALSIGFLQNGVADYKNLLAKKATFQDIELKKIKLYYNYRQYASYGFRILFQPDPLSILFTNSSVIQNMISYIDTSDRLNIDKSLKGNAAYKNDRNWFADFSGILLFFVTLISLIYGYTAFPNKDYQRFLTSMSKKKLFFSILISRAILLAIFLLFIIGSAILVITLNGISISINRYLFWFFIELYSVSLFFLFLGALFRTFKSHLIGISGSFITWFLLLFIVPFIIIFSVAAKSAVIKPEMQLDIEKLTLLLDFEKFFEEKTGVFGLNQVPTELQKELVQSFYQNEFKKMQTLEKAMDGQMQEVQNSYYKRSLLFPTTGYFAFTNEISSKGYKALDESYRYLIQVKEDFFKEYMEKVYFSSQTQPAKAEPFLKGDENIFKSKPALPDYFLLGIFFNLLWIVGVAMLSYHFYKKSLFELPELKKNIEAPQDIKLKQGRINSWHVTNDLLSRMLYSMLANVTNVFKKKGYAIKISLDNLALNTAPQAQNFIYLCHPSSIPGFIKVGNFLRLVMDLMKIDETKRKEIMSRFSMEKLLKKRFCHLEPDELGNIFLALLDMKQFDIYLIDDIGRGMYGDFCFALKTKMDELWDLKGSTVLLLSTDFCYLNKEKAEKGYFEFDGWLTRVENAREVMTQKE